jgi:predicted ATPase/transcriptional regulator with XRE-family HTH domain
METTDSFGYWVRRRRKALDLTQEELAQQVGCAVVSLRKIEADERRPSPQMAQRLAHHLALPPAELPRFMAAASGDLAPFHLPMSKAPAARLRSNLPAPVTSLVGRGAELAEITDGLREGKTRLLTLTGPVGVGKTRLALEAGRRLTGVLRDGVCLVALSSVQDPSLVPSATATALRVREARDCDLAQAVAGFLADREMLLIFDNFEHLLPAASFLEALLAASPGLRLLVTSRARLQLYGEHEFPVLPFHLPQSDDLLDAASADAVRLFCDRARAARAGFHLTPSLTPTVVEICQRLDGLPLAIELAAARLKTLSPLELCGRLAQGGPWLARDATPAQRQGLREALRWSYGLLSPAERTLLARLAIFVGGFSLPAADVVCAGWEGQPAISDAIAPLAAVSIAAGVTGLLDQSLLVSQNALSAACFSVTRCCGRCSLRTLRESSEAQSRFSMLEIIRGFALEHLAASGQMEQVRQRHARYYAAWAEQAAAQLNGPEQASWLLRLEQEADNLRAALTTLLAHGPLELAAAMACALGAFWQRHGHYREGRDWLEQVLAQLERTPALAVLRARTLQNAATLAYRQGDRSTARQWLDESLAIYRAASDQAGLARVFYDLGWIAIDQAEWQEAARLNQESLGWAQRVGDPCAIYSALTNLGWAQMCLGAWDTAALLFDQGHELAQQAGHLKGIAVSQANLGWIALHQGDSARAAALARESLQQCHLLGEREVLAECLEILAAVCLAEGDAKRAADLNAAAAALWKRLHVIHPPTQFATALLNRVPAALGATPLGALGAAQRPTPRQSLDALVAFALDCGGAP